jgi:peptidoglycan/xylan/chitin deacetylase (PgdA/CDA1 family)
MDNVKIGKRGGVSRLARWKQTAKSVILRTGILRLYASFRPQSAAILCYHSVAADPEGQSNYIPTGITVSDHLFDEQMRILRSKYNPVTLDDIADWLNGSKPLPPRSVAVTFDDGFEDNYTFAAPLMEKYNIFGAFYLTVNAVIKNELPWFCRTIYLFQEAKRRNIILTDEKRRRTWNLGDPQENREAFVLYSNPCAAMTGEEMENYVAALEDWFGFKLDLTQGPRMMSFAQAKELRQRGHIVGNHTFSHGNMGHIPPEAWYQEIMEANKILDRELGGKSEHFSYPHPCLHPQWQEQSLTLTKKIGFKTAVLTDAGVVTKTSNPLLLQRVYIGNDDTDAFCWRLDNAFAGRNV